jgi:phosphohistidine phosphatase SixA
VLSHHPGNEFEMAARIICLIRHGQHDSKNDDNDKLGGGLTSIGVEQAKLTAQRLRSLPISAIYCSTLRRAAETAEVIAQEFPDIPLQRSRKLRECIPCIPPIPVYIEYLAQVPAEEIAQYKYQAERAFDRMILVGHNDVGHLPDHLITGVVARK